MKKTIVLVVTLVLMCVAFAGCSNPLKKDQSHATVSVVTSDGTSWIGQSVNGAGMTDSGKNIALKNKSVLELKEGDFATVTFKCDACGKEEVYEVAEAWADTLSCDCPEKIDDEGNAKEYFSISISFTK